MHFFESVILGIVQGLTEFIPVSSSGHLIILPKIFQWRDFGLAFDVALHLGSVVALIIYFWKDWVLILSQFYNHIVKHKQYEMMESGGMYGKQFIPILVACVPAAIVGLLWDDIIEEKLRNPYLVIIPMALVGLVMLLGEKIGKRSRPLDKMTYKDYIIIGLSQAMALFPGVSRSGATITAGLFLNLKREAAARFSFLLSMPVIVGAGALQLFKGFIKEGIPPSDLPMFVVGFVVAGISGYVAIRFLMGFVQKRSVAAFAFYRFAFALFVLLAYNPSQ